MVCVYTHTQTCIQCQGGHSNCNYCGCNGGNLALQHSRIPMHNIRLHTYACNTQRMHQTHTHRHTHRHTNTHTHSIEVGVIQYRGSTPKTDQCIVFIIISMYSHACILEKEKKEKLSSLPPTVEGQTHLTLGNKRRENMRIYSLPP